ncbi:MAG: DUF4136 domain-containing protein [Bacteroidia bacterium]|nr:DUF4136 domain-containing protein [Bacteroidia bacterium]
MYNISKNNIIRRHTNWLIALSSALIIGFISSCMTTKTFNTDDKTKYDELNLTISGQSPNIINVHTGLKIYSDPDIDLSKYRTYDFDYTDKENPLLEKELFKMVENQLYQKGLKRSTENPDLLITMNFYTGKKEQYIPPKTVVTTRTDNVWSWSGHWDVVPITQSYTTEGYTEVKYYRNIRLNFLDYAKLKGGKELKTPPMVWTGEVESEGNSSDIRTVAPMMLHGLLGYEYPNKSGNNNMNRQIKKVTFGSLGITFHKEWRRIYDVEPGSVAALSGLHAGDLMLKIDGMKTKKGSPTYYYTKSTGNVYLRAFEPYYSGVLCNINGRRIEMEIKCPHEKTKKIVWVTPEVKSIYVTIF